MVDHIPEVTTPPMLLRQAKAMREEWYAFVRAHEPSIEIFAKRAKLARNAKAENEMNMWEQKKEATDIQQTAVQQYECILAIDVAVLRDEATLTWRNKQVRTASLRSALDALGTTHQTVEDMIMQAHAAGQHAVDHRHEVKETKLDPILQQFTRGIVDPDERRRMGLSVPGDPEPVRDLVDTTPIASPEPSTQVDNPGRVGQTAQASKGDDADEATLLDNLTIITKEEAK
jgi:hypothetical protein